MRAEHYQIDVVAADDGLKSLCEDSGLSDLDCELSHEISDLCFFL